VRRIDQWVPALHRGDAIGDSARLMRDAFRQWGYEADVYGLDVDEDLEGDGRPFSAFRPGGPEDVVILHFALPSPLTAALREHRGRRVLLHHNITPPEFFRGWDDELARICEIGEQELLTLRGQVDLALADSEWSRRELEELGFERTGVLPIYLDFRRYREAPNPVLRRLLRDGRTNILFVGRVAPNKRHDDLIRLASYWKRFLSPNLRLLLVGKPPRRREYMDALRSLHYEEALSAAEVTFLGHVPHDDLLACYASAHVFVSMSEHEGFGVPLVESMLMRVPVVAHRCTAVADTLGGAGLQFAPKALAEMTEAAHLLTTDRTLREQVLAGQDARLPAFAPAAVEDRLRGYLDVLARGGAARSRAGAKPAGGEP
jgi:glycosyltransferase involved in cell wall biosynthesis